MRRNPMPDRAGAVLLAGAMIIAPFLALLYRVEAGLLVMTAALIATAFVLREVAVSTAAARRPWVRLAIAADVTLALVCVGLFAILVLGG